MVMSERVALQEVPGQPQPIAPVRRRRFVAAHQEGRQAQQARRPDAGACRGDGAAGLRRDEGEAGGFAGDRAAVSDRARSRDRPAAPSPSGSGRRASPRPAADARSDAADPRTPADAVRVPAARLPPPRRPPTASPAPARSSIASAAARMHQFRAEAAELVGQPCDPAHLHQIARLPDRRAAPRARRRGPGRDARRVPPSSPWRWRRLRRTAAHRAR